MAYTMIVTGIQGVSDMLSRLGSNAERVASKGLYQGAGVMAEEIGSQADKIETEPFHYAVFITRKPSPEEKAVLDGRVGIAKFDKNGADVNTSVGYGNSGYATIAGRIKPVPKIANAINSGTSFMNRQPFVRKAATEGAGRASDAIVKTIEEDFDKITNA